MVGKTYKYDWIVWLLLIIGGLNWGLVGFFHYDVFAHIFGEGTMFTRVVYDVVGLAGLFGLYIFFVHKRT